MKRVLYVIVAIIVVILAYIGVYNYLKVGGVKIFEDRTAVITKESDTYLHYKVLNKRLLNDYGIDLRVLVDNDIKSVDAFVENELKNMIKHPRKKAKDFIFVLISPKNGYIKIASTQAQYKTMLKNKDINEISRFVIAIEDDLLEYEIRHSSK